MLKINLATSNNLSTFFGQAQHLEHIAQQLVHGRGFVKWLKLL